MKNGLIINTGNNQTKEEKDKLRRANTKKYSLPRSDIEAVELQVVDIEDIVAEGKGKRRRLKERKVLAPGEGEKAHTILPRSSLAEKEKAPHIVPLTRVATVLHASLHHSKKGEVRVVSCVSCVTRTNALWLEDSAGKMVWRTSISIGTSSWWRTTATP